MLIIKCLYAVLRIFLKIFFKKKVGKCLVFMKFVVPLHSQTRNKDTRKLKHGAIAQMVRAHDS